MKYEYRALFFEPELALLVGLQVMSSKEEGGRENFLTRFCKPRIKAYAGLGDS